MRGFVDLVDIDHFLNCTMIATLGLPQLLLMSKLLCERFVNFAAAFVISYVAFSVPAVVAGFAGTAFGLRITAEVYALVIIAIAVAALVLRIAGARRAAA